MGNILEEDGKILMILWVGATGLLRDWFLSIDVFRIRDM